MNQIDSAVSDMLYSAYLRHEPFACNPFGRELRGERLRAERLLPYVAQTEENSLPV
jgi:hypothetical protein